MNNFITCLLNIINNPDRKDAEYEIAYTILRLGKELEKLSLPELADLCHVSASTLNRFIKKYDFQKYSLFKQMYLQHLTIRKKQMESREEHKKDRNQIISMFFTQEEINSINETIDEVVSLIKESDQVILMGSDELISRCLRMQADFVSMDKMVIKESVFENNIYQPDSNELVFMFSMTGRLVDLAKMPIEKLYIHNPKVISVGYASYIKSNYLLRVPQELDELYEHLIVDYYMQEISYRYLKKYYGN